MDYRLGTFRDGAETFAGVAVDEGVVPLAELLPDTPTIEALLDDWPSQAKALQVAVEGLDRSSLRTGTTALAPYLPPRIFQSGANYRTHVIQLMVAAAVEKGADHDEAAREAAQIMDTRIAQGTPYVFLGLPSSVCGPTDDVVLPDTGLQHDWELELGVVIGTPGAHIAREDAFAHVAGYVVVNDLTTRDRVFRPDIPAIGTDWLAGKNAPTFLPLGPWIVPAEQVPDPSKLRITLKLNDEVMQDEMTADMIFDIPALLSHISSITPLLPGDLVLTGSPAGNGAHYGRYLREGDVMEATVTGPEGQSLGVQRNLCVRQEGQA